MKLTPKFLQPLDLSRAEEKPYGDEEPVRYERNDGNVSTFEGSQKAAQMHRQFRVGINQLKTFLIENTESCNEDACGARQGLELFSRRVAAGSKGHYGSKIETLYGAGKAALDALCADVKNEEIPLTRRVSAVTNLGQGVKVCSGGTLSNLLMTSGELRMSTLGVKGHARAAWEALFDQNLREYCQSKHGSSPGYLGREIHFVNGYRNFLGEEFGVETRIDGYVPISQIGENDLNAATSYMRQNVTADALLVNLGEMCLSEIRERFNEYVDRSLTAEDAWRFYAEYEETFQAELKSRYGTIESNVLMSRYEGKGNEDAPFRLVEHPALLIRAIARNLKEAEWCEKEKFQVELTRSGFDGETGEPVSVRLKRITDNAFYLKEMVDNGVKRYRSPQLQNLLQFDSIPPKVLKQALMSNPDEEDLAKLSAEPVWDMMLEDSRSAGTDLLDSFMHPLVKRFRDANVGNNNILGKRIIGVIRDSYSPTQMQAAVSRALVKDERVLAHALVKKFVRKLGSLDWHDEDGNNVLHWVASRGIEESVALLLQTANAVDVRKKNRNGATPLELAVQHGEYWVDGLQDLYPDCALASDGSTLLHEAVRSGSSELTRKILSRPKLDINAKTRNGRGLTALMEAVDGENANIIRPLAGASDLTILDERGLTPLMRAVADRKMKSLQALLAAGADVNYCTPYGKTALTTAVEVRSLQRIRCVLHAGANINEPREMTPLAYAALSGQVALVKYLLGNGARQDGASETWNTPVMLAAQEGYADVVRQLTKGVNSESLERSPELSARLGRALLLAAEKGYREVVRVLLSRGVRNEINDAIDSAAANGHSAVVNLLLNPPRSFRKKIVDVAGQASRGLFRGC